MEKPLIDEPSRARELFHQLKKPYEDAVAKRLRRYRDCVVFLQMDDCYVALCEDAETCSRVLGLKIIATDTAGGKSIPIVEIPRHAIESYISKMRQEGYKVVAIEKITCKGSRGLIERGVARIMGPTTKSPEPSPPYLSKGA